MANTRVILRSNIHLNKGPEFARLIMGQNTIYSHKKKKENKESDRKLSPEWS